MKLVGVCLFVCLLAETREEGSFWGQTRAIGGCCTNLGVRGEKTINNNNNNENVSIKCLKKCECVCVVNCATIGHQSSGREMEMEINCLKSSMCYMGTNKQMIMMTNRIEFPHLRY